MNLTFVPKNAEKAGEWVNSTSCVWAAPEWLQEKRPLNGVSKFTEHSRLFREILKIKDATRKDYIEDLKTLKSQEKVCNGRVLAIYECLSQGDGCQWRGLGETRKKLSSLRYVMLRNPIYAIFC